MAESSKWARFQKAMKEKDLTAEKVARIDHLGDTWDIYRGLKDGRVVIEVREDRV